MSVHPSVHPAIRSPSKISREGLVYYVMGKAEKGKVLVMILARDLIKDKRPKG